MWCATERATWPPRHGGSDRLNWVLHHNSKLRSEGREDLMTSDNVVQVRFGTPGNVLEVQVGTVEVDIPRSIGYFGGLVAAVGFGLIERRSRCLLPRCPYSRC